MSQHLCRSLLYRASLLILWTLSANGQSPSGTPAPDGPVANWIGHLPKSWDTLDFWSASSQTSHLALRGRQNGLLESGTFPRFNEQYRVDLQFRFALDRSGKLSLQVNDPMGFIKRGLKKKPSARDIIPGFQ